MTLTNITVVRRASSAVHSATINAHLELAEVLGLRNTLQLNYYATAIRGGIGPSLIAVEQLLSLCFSSALERRLRHFDKGSHLISNSEKLIQWFFCAIVFHDSTLNQVLSRSFFTAISYY